MAHSYNIIHTDEKYSQHYTAGTDKRSMNKKARDLCKSGTRTLTYYANISGKALVIATYDGNVLKVRNENEYGKSFIRDLPLATKRRLTGRQGGWHIFA